MDFTERKPLFPRPLKREGWIKADLFPHTIGKGLYKISASRLTYYLEVGGKIYSAEEKEENGMRRADKNIWVSG